MELFIEIVAIIMGVIGLLGCILPILPGPPLSYIALVLQYFFTNHPGTADEITGRFMITWLIITVVVTVLDYIVPAYFTKITGGTKEAVRGSIGGMLVGFLFFPPIGMIIGGFVGAMLMELYYHKKTMGASLLSALGSLLGFIFGTGIKLAASGIMLYYIIKFI